MAKKAKILLVDDDNDFIESTKMVLEKAPYDVIIAREGDEGLRKARAENPDLVLLDWELPGCSRKNRLAALGTPGNRRPKVIVLSTHDEVKMQSLEAGADAFVSKGDSPLKLLDAIQAVTKV